MALIKNYGGEIQPLTNPLAPMQRPGNHNVVGANNGSNFQNQNPITSYEQFKFMNQGPGVDAQANQATGSFLNSYQNRAPIANAPVNKVQNMPTEYYQKQIEDLSAPLTAQYDRARTSARGDQAARGTLYDSQGYQDIGQLDKSYLEQIGSITRGSTLEQMKEQQANEQAYQTALLGEGQSKRAADLQAMGLDVNMINSLLGYGADRYKSEADLFKGVYGTDVDYNKALIEQQPNSIQATKDARDASLRMLEMQGYQGSPQEQMWEALAKQMGFTGLVDQQRSDVNQDRINSAQDTGQAYYVNGKGWTMDGYKFKNSPQDLDGYNQYKK